MLFSSSLYNVNNTFTLYHEILFLLLLLLLCLLPYRVPATLTPVWLVDVKGKILVEVLNGFFRQVTEVRVGATRSRYDTAMYTHLRKLRIRISI